METAARADPGCLGRTTIAARLRALVVDPARDALRVWALDALAADDDPALVPTLAAIRSQGPGATAWIAAARLLDLDPATHEAPARALYDRGVGNGSGLAYRSDLGERLARLTRARLDASDLDTFVLARRADGADGDEVDVIVGSFPSPGIAEVRARHARIRVPARARATDRQALAMAAVEHPVARFLALLYAANGPTTERECEPVALDDALLRVARSTLADPPLDLVPAGDGPSGAADSHRLALATLGKLGDGDDVPLVARAIDHAALRLTALDALRGLEQRHPGVGIGLTPRLRALVLSDDEDTRAAAVRLLG